MRKQYKAYLFSFFSLAALLIGLPGIHVVFAQGQTQLTSHYQPAPLSCRWSVVPSPNDSSQNYLYGVAAVSSSDVWAVGINGYTQTLIEHWNGTAWSVVPSPNVGSSQNYLYGVAAISSSDVWAVGYYLDLNTGNYLTLIEQWNGTGWSVVPSPNINNASDSSILSGVTAVSSSDVWAVGEYENTAIGHPQTLIEQWNGTSWSIVPSPNKNSYDSLGAVAAVSSSDVWAVGDYLTVTSAPTLIEHWNGSSWSIVPSPNKGSYDSLNGVAVASESSVWAVGDYQTSFNSNYLTLIEQWNGTNWSVVSSPNRGLGNNYLNGVAAVSARSVWAVGDYEVSSGIGQTAIDRWNGTSWIFAGSLNVSSNSNSLNAVTTVPGSSNMWAVGDYGPFMKEHTLTEFFC